jgi:signal transduction histidine kinase
LAERENPTIKVETSLEGREVILAVIDNGPGIDLDDPSRVFDVFYSTKPNRGLGIGLSTAKLIVEMYDGSISVKSDPGVHTEFRIKLKQSDD